MNKKIMALFLVAAIFMNFCVPSYASAPLRVLASEDTDSLVYPATEETVGTDLQSINTMKSSHTTVEVVSGSSGIDNISDEQTFKRIFGGESAHYGQKGTGSSAVSAVRVTYDYEMSYDVELNLYDVTMLISFSDGGRLYSTTVHGSLTSTKVSDETVFLSGPLYGKLSVSDVPFTIIVGFNKVLGNDGFSGCVTMYTTDNIETADTFIRFHIAENVMTEEIIGYLVNHGNDQKDDDIVLDSEVMAMSIGDTNSGFVKCGNTLYGNLLYVSSATRAQRSEVYFKPGVNASDAENVIAVSVNSFCNGVNQAIAGFSTYYTRVSSISVEVGRNNSTAPLVEDFWRYGQHGLNSTGRITNAGGGIGDLLLDLVSQVFALTSTEYSAYASFCSALSTLVAINNSISSSPSSKLSEHNINFGAAGTSFDQYPYQVAYLLSGTRSTSLYSYYARVQVVYGTLDDSGLSYVSAAPTTHTFSVNFVHV